MNLSLISRSGVWVALTLLVVAGLGVGGYVAFKPEEPKPLVLGMAIVVPDGWTAKTAAEIPATVRYQPVGANALYQHNDLEEALIGFAVKETGGETTFDQAAKDRLKATFDDKTKGDLLKFEETKINDNPTLDIAVDITVQSLEPNSSAGDSDLITTAPGALFRVRRALMIVGDRLVIVTATAPKDQASEALSDSFWYDVLGSIEKPGV